MIHWTAKVTSDVTYSFQVILTAWNPSSTNDFHLTKRVEMQHSGYLLDNERGFSLLRHLLSQLCKDLSQTSSGLWYTSIQSSQDRVRHKDFVWVWRWIRKVKDLSVSPFGNVQGWIYWTRWKSNTSKWKCHVTVSHVSKFTSSFFHIYLYLFIFIFFIYHFIISWKLFPYSMKYTDYTQKYRLYGDLFFKQNIHIQLQSGLCKKANKS